MQLNFSSGTVIAKRTDVTNTQPAFLGVLQELQLNFDQTLKELYGQQKLPVDAAPSELKVTGTAKFARIQATQIQNLLISGTQTANSGVQMAVAEAVTPGATTFTVSKGTAFIEDLGVFYASSGIQLTPGTAVGSAGTYIPGVAGTGTYTINATDEVALLVYYSYTVTGFTQLAIANQNMGVGPVFELWCAQSYAVQGVTKTLNIKLNACRASKIAMPFKNTDYTIQDMTFTAFTDASNNLGTFVYSE